MADEVQVLEVITGRPAGGVPVDFLAKQTLSIGGAASAAFNRSTQQVVVISTTSCVVEFGAAPDGLGVTWPIVAGQIYTFSVQGGRKVIAASGTATAPLVTDTTGAAAAASLAVMDDWDESDRAKVNPIVGQAGVAAGAGAVTAAVQRVTLASDDPAVTKLTNGSGVSGSATFTPAAASHAAGDCNGAAADFTLAAPSGCRLLLVSATLSIAGGTAEATAWRLYLYSATPPSAIADDAPFDYTVATDGATFLGYIDLGTAADLGGGQWVEVNAINKAVKLTGTTVFGYLVNLTTLTPAAVAHTVTLVAAPL